MKLCVLAPSFWRARSSFLVLFALSALLWCAPGNANASIEIKKGDTIKLERSGDYGGANGGGRFDLYWFDSNASSYVKVAETFCMEYDEHIEMGTAFVVGAVSQRAVLGGANTNSGDDLDYATDWLYKNYVEGSLGSIDLGGGVMFGQGFSEGTWNNAFQRAVWKIEEEVSYFGNNTVGNLARKLRDKAVSETSNWTRNSGDVFVLNLFKGGTDVSSFDPMNESTWSDFRYKFKQDQLWYFHDDGPGDNGAVPEPASFLIWGSLGVAGIAYRRYRKNKKA